MLRIFVLGKTHARGLKIVKDCIYFGNVWVRLLKRPVKERTKRIQGYRDIALAVSIDELNDGQLVDKRSLGEVSSMDTYPGKVSTQNSSKVQTTEAKGRPVN